jgi:hypothetical protein
MLLFFFIGYSQPPVDIRLIKISGGNVNFIVNTYAKYLNGVKYPINTKLQITFRVDDALGWELYSWAGTDKIISESGEALDALDLDVLKLTVEDFSTNDGGARDVSVVFTLGDETSKTLIAHGPGGDPNQVDIVLEISYSLGSGGELMNKKEGAYYVDIHFQIVEL